VQRSEKVWERVVRKGKEMGRILLFFKEWELIEKMEEVGTNNFSPKIRGSKEGSSG